MTLELYILRRLVTGFAFACGGMLMVAIPCVLMHAVHKVAGVGMAAVLGFMPILMFELAPYLLPIGFLLTLVSTYGRLAADNEWTAILMAGVHPLRMVRPAALMALVLSVALYFLAAEVSPTLNYRKRSYGKSSVMRILRTLSPGRTELKFDEFYLSARERDADDRNLFREVFLHLPSDGEQPAQTLYAQTVSIAFEGSIMWVDLTWPRWADEQLDLRVGSFRVRADLDRMFGTESTNRNQWRFQDNAELERRIERTEELRDQPSAVEPKDPDAAGLVPFESLRWAKYELYSRHALAGICPMFLLLGIPTGLFLRRGSHLGALAAAIGYALIYYLLSMRLGKVLAGNEALPQWLAAWGTTLLGCAVGVVFSWRVLRR